MLREGFINSLRFPGPAVFVGAIVMGRSCKLLFKITSSESGSMYLRLVRLRQRVIQSAVHGDHDSEISPALSDDASMPYTLLKMMLTPGDGGDAHQKRELYSFCRPCTSRMFVAHTSTTR